MPCKGKEGNCSLGHFSSGNLRSLVQGKLGGCWKSSRQLDLPLPGQKTTKKANNSQVHGEQGSCLHLYLAWRSTNDLTIQRLSMVTAINSSCWQPERRGERRGRRTNRNIFSPYFQCEGGRHTEKGNKRRNHTRFKYASFPQKSSQTFTHEDLEDS